VRVNVRYFVLPVALLFPAQEFAQPALQAEIRAIAAEAHGKVSVACSLPGSSIDRDLNAHTHPPMQSVFKAPLAVTVLYLIEQGKWTLDQPIRFRASDRILPQSVSPLQDKYPAAEVDIPLVELLRLAVSESDNVAADLLLHTIGGPNVVADYLRSLGIRGFRLLDNEASLHREPSLQYRNWIEPAEAVQLLRRLADRSPLSAEHTRLVLGWMQETTRGPARIKGKLPAGAIVTHKPGSSGTDRGLTPAWNDIGLIALPDGRRLAIAIFVTNSTANETARDAVIARIARAAYDTVTKASP